MAEKITAMRCEYFNTSLEGGDPMILTIFLIYLIPIAMGCYIAATEGGF